MSNLQVAEPKTRQRVPLNGVDTPTLFATLDVVKAQPQLAKFDEQPPDRHVHFRR